MLLRRGRSSGNTTADKRHEVSDELLPGDVGLAGPSRVDEMDHPDDAVRPRGCRPRIKGIHLEGVTDDCSIDPATRAMTATSAGLPSGA